MSTPSSTPPSREVTDAAMTRAREIANGLYPHQVEGVAFLLARRRAILADDMGLGKTRQSIVAMHQAQPDGPWLVVCPASVKRNWEREIRMALSEDATVVVLGGKSRRSRSNPDQGLVSGPTSVVPDPSFRGWIVINYDIIKKHGKALGEIPFAGFVFDEAHYLKNHQSQRSRAARKLLDGAVSPVVHCLTGTPMMNRPRDLFPLLQLVNHSLGKSFLGFAKRYCDATKGDFGWETKGASNLDELTVQLHGTMLRRTKDEVLDLPGKMRTWLTVDVPATASRGMKRILATLLKKTKDHVDGARKKTALPPISRSRLIARLTPVRSSIAGAKMKYTTEFAKGILDQGEKVIIYSCFQEVIETFLESFAKEEVRWITGSAHAEDRQKAVDDFQNDESVRVLLATVIAGGVGINLTSARHVIFNDLDWVPANHWQAEDRVYRIGQMHPVNVYYFKAANSIDEFVGQVLQTKSDLISAVVDGEAITGAASSDVFGELERVMNELDLELPAGATNQQVESALHAAVAGYVAGEEQTTQVVPVPASRIPTLTTPTFNKDPLHQPGKANAETLRALAKALTPATTSTKYRTESSKPGKFYELEVDGTDVLCTCRGFEFRGQCKHARTLKDALASGDEIPDAFEQVK